MPRVAPWWSHYFADHFFRRLIHPPRKILGPHLAEGMTVLDLGCGMGVFTLAMARMVGPRGRVLAVDLAQRSLDILSKRAARAGLAERVVPRLGAADEIGLEEFSAAVDFALAFWMVHEAPAVPRFMAQVRGLLASRARFLVVEPIRHVPPAAFEAEIAAAADAGLDVLDRPRVRWSRAVLLEAL